MRSQAGTASCRKKRVRCAIYTRKSSDEGLEQGSSIRCRPRSARPVSPRHEGWVCLSQGYNDGGFSGEAMDRSRLRRLLADIAQAQREACEAFIASQRHEAGFCLHGGYDDGGFSGATTDRPALQRLLADITAGRASATRSTASSPTSSPAVRYWNRARQRYHRLSARYSRARVSLP